MEDMENVAVVTPEVATAVCEHCGEQFEVDEMVETVSGGLVCRDCLKAIYIVCADCGLAVEQTLSIEISDTGEFICADCYEEGDYFCCANCGDHFSYAELNDTGNGDNVCDHCLYHSYTECDYCHSYYPNHDMHYADGSDENVCDDCWDNNYEECCGCGEMFQRDNMYMREGDWYCRYCYEEREEEAPEPMTEHEILGTKDMQKVMPPTNVLGYHSNTPRCFFRDESSEPPISKYFGIELEIDVPESKQDGQHRASVVNAVLTALNTDENRQNWNHWTAMNDGSTSGYGFELISQPMTIKYMEQAKIIERLCDALQIAKDEGYRSHDTSTCGLHFHVSKNALSEECIVNAMMLVDKFWDVVFKMSRRNKNNIRWGKKMDCFCYLESDFNMQHNQMIDNVKNPHFAEDRYDAINLTNDHTIELRVCKGTMKKNTIMASLHFFDFLLELGEAETRYRIFMMTKEEFIDKAKEYHPSIKTYFEERDIA